MQMTLRLACVIGIVLAGLLRVCAPHYHLTAEIIAGLLLLFALVATVVIDETKPAGINQKS